MTLLIILIILAVILAQVLFGGWIIMVILGALGHMLGLPWLCIGLAPSALFWLLVMIVRSAVRSDK